jgi:hypothetical protein
MALITDNLKKCADKNLATLDEKKFGKMDEQSLLRFILDYRTDDNITFYKKRVDLHGKRLD